MLMSYLIWGAIGLLAGYTVYSVTVAVLDRSNIKSVIQSAIEKMSRNKKLKAIIAEITDNGTAKKVKIDILDELDGQKECEVEITGNCVDHIYIGDIIYNID